MKKIFATIFTAMSIFMAYGQKIDITPVSTAEWRVGAYRNIPLDHADSITFSDSCIGGAACKAFIEPLYNELWYYMQRGFFKIGDGLSGNYYEERGYEEYGLSSFPSIYASDVAETYGTLWGVIDHCIHAYRQLTETTDISESERNLLMGEVLTWKAMAYFYMVRIFGDVPLVHDDTEQTVRAVYTSPHYSLQKVEKADVYEYIVMTLEEAMRLMVGLQNEAGRIDYYSAEGLLAKVELTRAGVRGTLDMTRLTAAAQFAQDVIENSGRQLTAVYSDIFRASHNRDSESLIAWHWYVSDYWGTQNSIESDFAMSNFSDQGDCWGGWVGPSVDLMNAFGVVNLTFDYWDWNSEKNVYTVVYPSPIERVFTVDADRRRQATMMLPLDYYPNFWRDKDGFDVLDFVYNCYYGPNNWGCPTGAHFVKHLYGNDMDHAEEVGCRPARMASGLSTHLLRLADVYLVHAEASLLTGNDSVALNSVNTVRQRACAPLLSEVNIGTIWKERRLELALEGDYWYDFVRRSYYDVEGTMIELRNQYRFAFAGIDDVYRRYAQYRSWDTSDLECDWIRPLNVDESSFILHFPDNDRFANPNLSAAPIHVDVRQQYSY